MKNLTQLNKFIGISFTICFAFVGIACLHNIDNITNVVNIEQTQLKENNNFLSNVDLMQLFMLSETYTLFYILGTTLIIIAFIYWWGYENTSRARDSRFREIH